jgi:hypothetical protein
MEQQAKQEELLSQAMDLIVESGADLRTLFDQNALLKKLTKSLVERALLLWMNTLGLIMKVGREIVELKRIKLNNYI